MRSVKKQKRKSLGAFKESVVGEVIRDRDTVGCGEEVGVVD